MALFKKKTGKIGDAINKARSNNPTPITINDMKPKNAGSARRRQGIAGKPMGGTPARKSNSLTSAAKKGAAVGGAMAMKKRTPRNGVGNGGR